MLEAVSVAHEEPLCSHGGFESIDRFECCMWYEPLGSQKYTVVYLLAMSVFVGCCFTFIVCCVPIISQDVLVFIPVALFVFEVFPCRYKFWVCRYVEYDWDVIRT